MTNYIQSNTNLFRVVSVYVIPCLFSIFLIGMAPDFAYTEPDSQSYINFSSSRSIGYPVLLFLSSYVFGDYNHIVVFQVLFFAVGSSFFINSIFSENRLVSLLFVSFYIVGVIANSIFIKYHYSILTESFFFSFVVFLISFIIRAVKEPGVYFWWIGFGCCIGFSILVRPVGYSFLPLIFIVFALLRWVNTGVGWRNFLFALISCFFVLGLGGFAEREVYGDSRASLLPLVIFGKGMLVEAGEAPSYYNEGAKELWDQMEKDGSSVRSLLSEASSSSFAAEKYLRQNYEVYFQYQYKPDLISRLAVVDSVSVSDLKLTVGLGRLKSDFLGYVALSIRNYVDLWSVYGMSFAPFVDAGNSFINEHRPLPFNSTNQVVAEGLRSRAAAWAIFPMMIVASFVSFLILALGAFIKVLPHDLQNSLILPLIMSMMVNGNFLLIGLLGIGISRYSQSMIIPVAVMLLSFLGFLRSCYTVRLESNRIS